MSKLRDRQIRPQLLIACLLCATASGTTHADGLREALQATLLNHPAVTGQQAQVEARRYAADGARSQRYPTISAQAQHYTDGNRSVLAEDDLDNPAVLRLRQPIWAFGRINNSIAAANAEVSTERADLLRVRRQLLEDTAVAYAEVRASREYIDVARQNVGQLEELHAQIQRRVDGQLASSADARLAATRLAQGRAKLEQAVSAWDIARDDLAALTQVALDADQPVPSGLLALPESANLVEQALAQSAEIQVKERQLNQAEAEIDQAKTYYMPTIYLQADRFYDQPGLRDDSQVSVVFEGALDGLGFAARGRTGEAVASRDAATQDLAATRISLRHEIERLQRSRQLQGQLVELQTQSLADLEVLLASYQRQYETGTKSWLDLMNIQRELFEQKGQLVQARSGWNVYSLQLLARTGGLDDLAGMPEQEHDG